MICVYDLFIRHDVALIIRLMGIYRTFISTVGIGFYIDEITTHTLLKKKCPLFLKYMILDQSSLYCNGTTYYIIIYTV